MKIGESVPRLDATSKVTGTEKYAADYYGPSGTGFLWAGVRRAGVAHGIIKSIGTERAYSAPGVVAVLTHKDIKGTNRQGVIRQDQPVLADDKVRHAGEAVALVLGETKEALKQAIALIDVVIEPLPGVFSIDDAIAENAPLLHPDNPTGNLVREVEVVKGRGEGALEDCDVTVEFAFETPRQEHAYLETEAGWAYMDGEDVVIVASTQTPFRDRFEIGHAIGLDPQKIRVIAPYLGGAFGGKDGVTVQSFLALAALHSGGTPVKMWWDREESFAAGVKRLPARMVYRLGAQKDGTITALSCRLLFESGAYANLSGEIMTLAVEHAGGPYRIPHTYVNGRSVYTNNGLGGPFRGFGVPQVTAAIEQAVDILAAKLSMDPLELRYRNAICQGDENCIGVTMARSTNLKECIDAIRNHTLWRTRQAWKTSAPPLKRRGIGTAALFHAMGYPKDVPDRAGAKIELTAEGTVRISTGVVDMGQGNASTYVQMAGQILNQDENYISLVLPDTARTLPCGSASASRCTYVFGNALIEAASSLRTFLFKKAAQLLGVDESRLMLEPGQVRVAGTGEVIGLTRIAASCSEDERLFTSIFTSPVAPEDSAIIYLGPHLLYSYAAHLVRIEIDEITGQVEVKDYLAATDGGRVLNPQFYEQQIHGSIAQGIGYALMERFIFDRGSVATPNFVTYVLPTASDIGDITTEGIEIVEETGPFGMKGIGEIAVNGPLPAIANALADALGIRPIEAPFTGEAVLEAMSHIRACGNLKQDNAEKQ